MLAESWGTLMHDGGHWLFEITSDIVLGVVLYAPAKWVFNRWHRRHDREVHS